MVGLYKENGWHFSFLHFWTFSLNEWMNSYFFLTNLESFLDYQELCTPESIISPILFVKVYYINAKWMLSFCRESCYLFKNLGFIYGGFTNVFSHICDFSQLE